MTGSLTTNGEKVPKVTNECPNYNKNLPGRPPIVSDPVTVARHRLNLSSLT